MIFNFGFVMLYFWFFKVMNEFLRLYGMFSRCFWVKNKCFDQKKFYHNFSITTITENWIISNNMSFDLFFLERLGSSVSSKIKKITV